MLIPALCSGAASARAAAVIRNDRVIEQHGVFAELRLVPDPVLDVATIERLRQHVAGCDAGRAVLVDDFLRELLAREPVERQPHARLFELGRHVHAEPLEQLDALGVRQKRAARGTGAKIRPRRTRGRNELLDRLRSGIERVHLARSVLNSASVSSLVRHSARAARCTLPSARKRAGSNGSTQVRASGVSKMSVVVARSFCECRQTSTKSLVNVTSHSSMPAPMR